MKAKIPLTKNLVIAIGTDYDLQVVMKSNGEPLPLAGWEAWAEVWNLSGTPAFVTDFTVTITDNVIYVSLPSAATSLLNPAKGLSWSLRIKTDADKIFDLYVGTVSFVRNATIPLVS